ncbi:MAG TPA: LysE family translocator [Solimonas sp.]
MTSLALTWTSAAALFGAMALLAALPSVSVFAVASRAAAQGFRHGALTALGVVVGDLLFIALAIFGLGLLAEAMGERWVWLRYAAALYLMWLGWRLWRAAPGGASANGMPPPASAGASFMTGLLITLADQKAIFFYLGFFPAFLDLAAMTWLDALWIMLIAVVSVGGVKLIYAALADRAGHWLGGGAARMLNRLAAAVLVGAAVMLVLGA